jgi:hypothetical protein
MEASSISIFCTSDTTEWHDVACDVPSWRHTIGMREQTYQYKRRKQNACSYWITTVKKVQPDIITSTKDGNTASFHQYIYFF